MNQKYLYYIIMEFIFQKKFQKNNVKILLNKIINKFIMNLLNVLIIG